MLVLGKTLSNNVISTITKRYNSVQFKENVFMVSLKRFVDRLQKWHLITFYKCSQSRS